MSLKKMISYLDKEALAKMMPGIIQRAEDKQLTPSDYDNLIRLMKANDRIVVTTDGFQGIIEDTGPVSTFLSTLSVLGYFRNIPIGMLRNVMPKIGARLEAEKKALILKEKIMADGVVNEPVGVLADLETVLEFAGKIVLLEAPDKPLVISFNESVDLGRQTLDLLMVMVKKDYFSFKTLVPMPIRYLLC